MYHPLYYRAMRCSGRSVFIHHNSGRVFHGTVVSVAPHGLYVMQHPPGTMLTDFLQDESQAHLLDQSDQESNLKAELVYSPVSYFAFGALTGLTLGAVAGAYMW